MSNINPEIAHLAHPVTELTHFDGNARKHDLQTIAASLKANGQYRPIVARKSDDPNRHAVVLAGNGTLTAARDLLKWEHIAVTWVECDDQQARRIVIVDNRANDLSTYDDQALADLLQSLDGDFTGTGFTADDLDALLSELLDTGDLPDTADLDRDWGEGEEGNLNVVKFGNVTLRLTDAEVAQLTDLHEKFLRKNGTNFGFIGWLCDGRRGQ